MNILAASRQDIIGLPMMIAFIVSFVLVIVACVLGYRSQRMTIPLIIAILTFMMYSCVLAVSNFNWWRDRDTYKLGGFYEVCVCIWVFQIVCVVAAYEIAEDLRKRKGKGMT